VGENPHDIREAMTLEQGEKLKCLHFKTQTGVNNKQHDVCYFGQVYHGCQVVRTLDYRNSLLFVAPKGNAAVYLLYFVLGVVLDERSYH